MKDFVRGWNLRGITKISMMAIDAYKEIRIDLPVNLN